MEPINSKVINGLKVTIDRDLCIGAGSCELLAPEVFGIDAENKVFIKDGPTQTDQDTIIQAAMSCPVLAIILERDGVKVWPEA